MVQDREAELAQRWYGTNLVGVPARVLASAAFNAHPTPLAIAGTYAAHRTLFELLDASADLNEAHDMFSHYLHVAFGLRKPEPHELATMHAHDQRRWRSSWRKLLQGWGMDSNGPAGAVLKGWVEFEYEDIGFVRLEAGSSVYQPPMIKHRVSACRLRPNRRATA